MPSYDPAVRSAGQDNNLGGASTSSVPKPAGTVNGDLVLVVGFLVSGAQINAPDGTWTRVNSVVSNYQAFYKRAGSSEPSSWTFTWNGVSQAYVFNSFSLYSQAGGTISFDTASMSSIGGAIHKASDAITPSANALVLISWIEMRAFGLNDPTPSGLTLILKNGGFNSSIGTWAGDIYVSSGVSSGTYDCASGDTIDPSGWGSGTFSFKSSIVNPLSPPFVDDEVAFTPAIPQTVKPPFVDDELAFQPSIGLNAIHVTTSNSEVALRETAAGTNLRITEQSSEAATQVSLVGVAQLRATQVTAEVALQALPPIGPVDFEIQTPSRQLDPAQLGMTKRIYIDVDCNRSGPTWGTTPQVLFPTLILDNVTEVTLPAITNNGRGVIEIAFQQKSRLVALRLANPQLRGRVEVFGIHWDNPIGRGPGES